MAQSSNTIADKARARLSLRTAPGEDPAAAYAALRDHLEANAPFGAQVTVVEGENQGQSYRASDNWPAAAVCKQSLTDAWGSPAVEIGIGGSIPFIADLLQEFPASQILVTGVTDPDSRAHGPNESVHLAELEKAVLAEILLVARLAAGAGVS